MSDNIVKRLRDRKDIVLGADTDCAEAADEIERLRAGGCARNQRTTQFCAEASDAIARAKAAEARAVEAERENYELRLIITGGEDAPGYVNSIPLEHLREDHERLLRDMADAVGWRERQLAAARSTLAHTDMGSLPDDWTLHQIAEARIDDLITLRGQVRDTCRRAERAEAQVAALREALALFTCDCTPKIECADPSYCRNSIARAALATGDVK